RRPASSSTARCLPTSPYTSRKPSRVWSRPRKPQRGLDPPLRGMAPAWERNAMSAPELDSLKTELIDAIARASSLGALEEVRVGALGRRGRVSELMQGLGALPPEERKSYGQAVNSLKESVVAALDARREFLSKAATAEKLASERADVTLPVREGPLAVGR